MQILLAADDRAGQLVRALTYQSLAYASERIPEIADTPLPIDDAMRWGFGREAGPFETWDMIGVAEGMEKMAAAGFPAAMWVEEMLHSGHRTFYEYANGNKVKVYHPAQKTYVPIARPHGLILLAEHKAAGKLIKRNPAASLLDIGDGVACVELHGKMNVLEPDTFTMIQAGLERLETEFEGMVIGTEGEHFSAGFNLGLILMAAKMNAWDQIDASLRQMQELNMRMRYFPKPVVVAPAGYTMGGGAEVTMHGCMVVAAAEMYTGLVEIAMGLIPAGGGTKEIMRRVINPPMRTKNAELLPYLQRAFEQIGMGKVGTSAEEGRQMGILSPCDRVVMNRDFLLSEAKKEVLHLAVTGYHPPLPEAIYAAGRDGLAALRVGIYMMKEGGYITEYEAHLAGKLAHVLTGGEISSPAWVSEQYILDLEREAFISLCGEAKTQERIWAFLETGKRIRN
jgi:3-hydroxyacyl-CoA dehydrogenase